MHSCESVRVEKFMRNHGVPKNLYNLHFLKVTFKNKSFQAVRLTQKSND